MNDRNKQMSQLIHLIIQTFISLFVYLIIYTFIG